MEKSIGRNAVFNMMNRGLMVVFPIFTMAYVSRILGAPGIGKVASAQNYSTYFTMFAALGIPSYGVKVIAQSKKDQKKCNKAFTELFIINFSSTVLCIAVYIIMLYLLRDNYITDNLYDMMLGSKHNVFYV